jgi:hypothetical protein
VVTCGRDGSSPLCDFDKQYKPPDHETMHAGISGACIRASWRSPTIIALTIYRTEIHLSSATVYHGSVLIETDNVTYLAMFDEKDTVAVDSALVVPTGYLDYHLIRKGDKSLLHRLPL